jgi:hypothetical protein
MSEKWERVDALLYPFVPTKRKIVGFLCATLACNSLMPDIKPTVNYLRHTVFAQKTVQEKDLAKRLSALGTTVSVSCRPLFQMLDNAKDKEVAVFGYVPSVGIFIVTHSLYQDTFPSITIDQLDCDLDSAAFEGHISKDESTALALGRLSHEYQHVLNGHTTEAENECANTQLLKQRLEALNFSPAIATALSDTYADSDRLPNYLSPECRPGGKLDLRVSNNYPFNPALRPAALE